MSKQSWPNGASVMLSVITSAMAVGFFATQWGDKKGKGGYVGAFQCVKNQDYPPTVSYCGSGINSKH